MSTHGMSGSVSSNERGMKLLERSTLNKGTAFTDAERAAFGLEGLLPPSVETLYQQHRRILQQLGQKPTDLERYEMFIEPARATADQVTDKQLKMGMLYPPQSNILDTEVRTAERVARLVFERNIAREDPPNDINALQTRGSKFCRAMLYKPEYPALVH
ncbi:MAG: hypothetical protein WBE68_23625 [Candidatus Nitrosopolaris sp.]